MEKKQVPYFSYENSKRIIEQNYKIDRQIGLMADVMHKQREQIVHEVNKAVYELAEKKNISVYDICFRFMPIEKCIEARYDDTDRAQPRCIIDMQVELTPIQFELEKGPGYWKEKYYRLKNKMQELVDNKDD